MAKETRKSLRSQSPEDESPVLPREAVYELTTSRHHMTCPVCGMMAPIERTETPITHKIVGFKGGPYDPQQREQKFGGSAPSEDGTMASRPGGMEWTKAADLSPEQMDLLIDRIEASLGYLRELMELRG